LFVFFFFFELEIPHLEDLTKKIMKKVF